MIRLSLNKSPVINLIKFDNFQLTINIPLSKFILVFQRIWLMQGDVPILNF